MHWVTADRLRSAIGFRWCRIGLQFSMFVVLLFVIACFAAISLQTTLFPTVYAEGQAPADDVITDCTSDSQLRVAATAPATTTITFSCGPGLHTVPIASYMPVQGHIIIEGNEQITLDGSDSSAFFQIFIGAKLELRNITLQNGVLNNINPLENFGTLTLVNATIQENQAQTAGAIENQGALVVVDSIFLNNQSAGLPDGTISGNGGAIYSINNSTTIITGSTFSSNKVTSNSGSGGAIALESGHLTISGSTFRNNEALDGGAVHVGASGVATITESVFTNNTGGYGGAIESNGQTDLRRSVVSNNRARTGDGGGIWVLAGDMDIEYTTISGNTANTTGGGISCYGDNVSVIHSTISGNQSTREDGGGIYSLCNLNLTNSTISANKVMTVTAGGGGIYQGGTTGTATVAAVTLFGNEAEFGGGVYNDNNGSTMTLQYTLLAENDNGNCDGVVTSQGFNLSTDTKCALAQTGDDENVALPLGPLRNNGGPTLTHLPLEENPAIDAIPTPCGFDRDQRDVARPQNGACDIGAIERSASDAIFVYLPAVYRNAR